ncbi:MAG: L,D-transpeptidase family protein [Nitrospirae bacterium]|nr:L,D-transpeptidase family protein [Nitrospirota bacterium]
MAELLNKRINAAGSHAKIIVGDEKLHTSIIIARLYKERAFQPVWVQDQNFLIAAAKLTDAINDAYLEGLAPGHYHLEQIKSVMKKVRKDIGNESVSAIETLVDLDLLLTDAFLMLSCQYSAGCENPAAMESKRAATIEETNILAVLESVFREKRIKEALNGLLPSDEGYARLRKALSEYRVIAEKGGWPEVSSGPLLSSGKRDNRVIELRNRLLISGDYIPGNNSVEALFDDALKDAVLRFQNRHGLNMDGVVGKNTLNTLNISAESRVRQIELNLERLRWSRNKPFNRYVRVNIADFRLDVIEKERSVMSMKVVVGKPYWNTPVFDDLMTHIVFNPSWNIPMSIAINEVLPKIKSAKDYLTAQNIIVLNGFGDDAQEIAPDSIDWSRVSDDNFQFNLRQKPGPLNPLGRVKFVFPNRFNVYMHDTPFKRYFSNEARGFSHGCIRLERPVELAEYLLKDDQGWPAEKIQEAISNGKEKYVKLAEPVAVNIIYLTAWVDQEGQVQFRNDIYGRDKKLDNYLKTQ